MNRRMMLVTGVVVVAIVLTGAIVASSVLGSNKAPQMNVVQVYINTWSIDPGDGVGVNVQFKISMDLNGDGVFEVARTSDVFNDTYVELAPYKLGGPISTSIDTFAFKIEVFLIADGVQQPLPYTIDGQVPVNEGINVEDSSNAWSYDAPSGSIGCQISYSYFVN